MRKWREIGESNPLTRQRPKVLLFDLECAPMEVYAWGFHKQHISPSNMVKNWSIIAWSAKWLYEEEVFGKRVTANDAVNRDDSKIIKDLWNLFDEADVLIAHNLRGFDQGKANARFILNGLEPPSPYQCIDTLQHCRKEFKFNSNALGFLGEILLDEKKGDTSWSTWRGAVEGKASCLKELFEYCKQDVLVLEDLYMKIRGWIKGGPNLALYYDDIGNRCANCGSKNLKRGKKGYYTATGRYHTVRCEDCSAIGRSRYMSLSADERKELFRSVAR